MLLIINYHYFGEANYPFEAIYPISNDTFAEQLDIVGKHCTFLDEQTLTERLADGSIHDGTYCLVTIDDGLVSQYTHALQVLREKDIPAIFFMNGIPFQEKQACPVHKIHYLRAHIDPNIFSKELLNILTKHFDVTEEALRVEDAVARDKYIYDTLPHARLKTMLNHTLPREIRDKAIEMLFAKFVPDEAAFVDSWYVSKAQIQDIARTHDIGLHGYAHQSVATLGADEFRRDVERNITSLQGILPDYQFRGFSYPFKTDKKETVVHAIDQLKVLGIEYAVCMNRAANVSVVDPYFLSRYDTNDVPGGKAPRFTMDAIV